MTGGPQLALAIFLAFYVTCVALTWWYYLRKSSVTAGGRVSLKRASRAGARRADEATSRSRT